uniref:Uncharacterized protein n=1 Tax=uncultured marine thaumarchaeote KM3_06_C02 TaxID=1455976 RepID=A0A075GAJ5_9ARCH|nr:hypothetical protein [uncultured marine thaumarchaeote KM3_06_C02]
MHRGFLLTAVFLAIIGLGFTAETLDWNPDHYGPKNRLQTAYLAIGLLTMASFSALLGLYFKKRIESDRGPTRIYCSYCELDNPIDVHECINCQLSSYLEFIYE